MRLKYFLPFFLASLICTAYGQSYTYECNPNIGTYTEPSSVNGDLIDYDSEQFNSSVRQTYSGGNIQTTVSTIDDVNGAFTFRIKKRSGYFTDGSTFKIFIHEYSSNEILAKEITVSGSNHSSYTVTWNYGNFSGKKAFMFYLITKKQQTFAYGGIITIEGTEHALPDEPYNPTPSDGATNQPTSLTLKWNSNASSYRILWGTSRNNLENEEYSNVKNLYLYDLEEGTTYYWQVEAYNTGYDIVEGDIWRFTTKAGETPNPPDDTDMTQEQAVAYLQDKGVIDSGDAAVTDLLLRQQLAKIAFRGVYSVNGRSVPSSVPSDNYPTVYSDLNDRSAYYYQSARALLFLEYGDGVAPFDRDRLQFSPEDNIARLHVLKVLMETFNIKPSSLSSVNPFPADSYVEGLKTAGNPKYGYIVKAAELGIIAKPNNGMNTEFHAERECTRGEVFIMLARIMTKIESGDISDPSPSNADYFEPLNLTLKTISMGLSLPMGNFQHYTKTSFAIDGTIPLLFAHTYNSYNTTLPDVFYGIKNDQIYQPMGTGWSHNYHAFMTVAGSGSNRRVIVHWGGGSIDIYKSNGSDFVAESIGVYDELAASGNNYVIKTKNQNIYTFGLGNGTGPAVYYLKSVQDRNGNTLTINYNSNNNVSTVSDGNRQLTFSYNSAHLLERVTDPLGREISFTYILNLLTGRYQLRRFTDAEGNTTTYEYGDDSRVSTSRLLTRIELPKGNYIENEYDEKLRLQRSFTPQTETQVDVTASYSSSSISTSSSIIVDRGSKTSTYGYSFNGDNSITSMTGDLGLSASAEYGSSRHPQLPTSVQTNNKNISNVSYDDRGNVTSMTLSGDGTLTKSMTYDSMNNLTSVTDAMDNVTTYSYDQKGNLIGVTAPEGVSTSITVDSKGLPTTFVNTMGVVTEFTYNSYGNLTKTLMPAVNLSSSAEFDAASRMLSFTDPAGRVTTYSYDRNDNIIETVDPEDHNTSFGYDANDNLTSITNAKGGVTSLSYDNVTDWLTSVEFGGHRKEYDYNSDGSLNSVTKPDGTVLSYSYDKLGRITSDGVNDFIYDNKMRLESVSSSDKSVSFSYDGFNRVIGTSGDGADNSYSYDKNGNVTSVNDTEYDYDHLNRLTAVTFSGKTISYSYRKDSKLSEIAYPNGMTTSFGYDVIGRLTSKKTTLVDGTVVASYSYELDNLGNITKRTRKEPYVDMVVPAENESCTYNDDNRIVKSGDTNFAFDENGNTTQRGSEQYVWDKQDRLTKAGGTKIEYNPLGHILKYGDISFTTNPLGIGHVLSDSKSGASYIYGNGLEARVVGGKTSYYVTDCRGSVVAIVDDNGTITHKYQYDEFGRVTQKEEADYNPFQYVGKYGVMYLNNHLYYMRARHYDPTIGRFLSEDPIWSTNLYPYANNNPIMGIDPEGLKTYYSKEVSSWFHKYAAKFDSNTQTWTYTKDGKIVDNDKVSESVREEIYEDINNQWTCDNFQLVPVGKDHYVIIDKYGDDHNANGYYSKLLRSQAKNALKEKYMRENNVNKVKIDKKFPSNSYTYTYLTNENAFQYGADETLSDGKKYYNEVGNAIITCLKNWDICSQ